MASVMRDWRPRHLCTSAEDLYRFCVWPLVACESRQDSLEAAGLLAGLGRSGCLLPGPVPKVGFRPRRSGSPRRDR
jgi:hypothetical protein